MSSFKIGINMAGAVSAGAYTAGVLDFLIQALDEWHAAKARGEAVPRHEVSIEVLSGASAGGMCAAIGGLAFHQQFPPVEQMNPTPEPSANKLYSSWVQKVDIAPLLQTADLQNGGPVLSILDSTVLSEIAGNALTPAAPQSRKYVSSTLTLFLTLTNLRGIVYDIDPANGGTFEEQIAYYADQLRFEIVRNEGDRPTNPLAKPLPLNPGQNGNAAWQLLQTAALATGAFPVALAPRILERDRDDYDKMEWSVSNPAPTGHGDCDKTTRIPPDWGSHPPTSLATVNVDGGTTDNDPFELAHEYIVSLSPEPPSGHARRDAAGADRAIITIAPFPGVKSYDPNYDARTKQGLVPALFALLGALIAQSRFQGESIQLLQQANNFSRFVIAPSDNHAAAGQPALMSSAVGAFGGFLYRAFRDRDYQLGRRNCQYFLKEYFVLEAGNPIVAGGLPSGDPAARSRVIKAFRASSDPAFQRPEPAITYMPIIPLCGKAAVEVHNPGRPQIPQSVLKAICKNASNRLAAVLKAMLRESSWLVRTAASIALFFFKGKIGGTLQDYLMKNLGAAVDQGK
jgi:hypothetical protein